MLVQISKPFVNVSHVFSHFMLSDEILFIGTSWWTRSVAQGSLGKKYSIILYTYIQGIQLSNFLHNIMVWTIAKKSLPKAILTPKNCITTAQTFIYQIITTFIAVKVFIVVFETKVSWKTVKFSKCDTGVHTHFDTFCFII